MAIDGVSGGKQPYSLQGSGASAVNDAERLANLPSYLTEGDLDFSSAVTGVLGIRVPMAASITDELMFILLETETALRGNNSMGDGSLGARLGSIISESDLSALSTQIIQASIDVSQELLAQAQEQLDFAQASLLQLEDQRASFTSGIADYANAIAGLDGQISPLDSQIASLDSNIASVAGIISGLQEQIATANGNIAALQAQQLGYTNQINDLQAQKTDLIDQIADLNTQIADLEGQPGDHSAEIDDLEAQRNALVAQTVTINNNIASLQGLYDAATSDIGTIQAHRNGLTTQLNNAVSQRDGYVAQRAALDLQRQPLVADRAQKAAEKAALENALADVNNNISNTQNTIATLNDTVSQTEAELENLGLAYDDVMAERTMQNEQINEIKIKQQSDGFAASKEDLERADRLFDIIKQILKSSRQMFWNETIRERVMLTEKTREAENLNETASAFAQFSAFSFTRTLQGEVMSNPAAITNRELDKLSADRAFDTDHDIISTLADIMKAVEEVLSQSAPEQNLQNGKVMLSLS